MKRQIIILTVLTLVGCKAPTLVGEYKQYSVFISGLTLNSDSTFYGGTSFCAGSASVDGQWKKKGNYLYMTPIVPANIYYDTITKRYQYKPDTLIVFNSVYDIKVKADINTDYSPHIFKISKSKLYLQYKDTNGVINYSDCPFYKIPKNSTQNKLRKLERKNEIQCSGLNGIQKFLLKLRLIK